jgi:hypothetical protein
MAPAGSYSIDSNNDVCEPVTIIAGVGMAMSAYSGLQASNAAKAQGAEADRQGRFNAQMTEYAALDAESRGREQAAGVLRDADALKGEQNAAAAANGVTAGYGTLAQIAEQTDFFAALDANTATSDASRDAWTARTQGVEAMRAGRSANAQARQQSNAILLNTGATVGMQWYQMMKKPPPPPADTL